MQQAISYKVIGSLDRSICDNIKTIEEANSLAARYKQSEVEYSNIRVVKVTTTITELVEE